MLKQQSNSSEEYADSTKKILQQLVDRTSQLMAKFYRYDELYEPIVSSYLNLLYRFP